MSLDRGAWNQVVRRWRDGFPPAPADQRLTAPGSSARRSQRRGWLALTGSLAVVSVLGGAACTDASPPAAAATVAAPASPAIPPTVGRTVTPFPTHPLGSIVAAAGAVVPVSRNRGVLTELHDAQIMGDPARAQIVTEALAESRQTFPVLAGDQVEVLATQGNDTQVRMLSGGSAGQVGWLSSRLVTVTFIPEATPTPPRPPVTVIVN